jgi:hypothetical protein
VVFIVVPATCFLIAFELNGPDFRILPVQGTTASVLACTSLSACLLTLVTPLIFKVRALFGGRQE